MGGGVGPLIALVRPVRRASKWGYGEWKVRRVVVSYCEMEQQIQIDEKRLICWKRSPVDEL